MASLIEQMQGELAPRPTRYRIAFHDPLAPGEPLKIIAPAPRFMSVLMHGGVVPRVRVIGDTPDGKPILDGSGEVMGAMSEEEAVDFVRWKDVPPAANRWAILTVDDIPKDRTFRQAWELA